MKKINLFSFALAGLMLGACSSETELVTSNQGPEWNANGKGYVNLAIQLPTQPSSRADAAFNDGTPAEYQVNDATLILFVNDKINSAYDMSLHFSPEGTSIDQITTTSKITQEINEISDPNPKIQALVVLNRNDLFTVSGGDLLVGNKSMKGYYLTDLNNELKSVAGDYSWHDNGFLMSNAVMATAEDPTIPATVTKEDPLVTITGGIYSTKAEAEANPAATIYVERAEAKITVNKSGTMGSETTASNLPFTIEGWGVDNYNMTNKLVRTASGFEDWKDYVSTHVATTNPTDYRFLGTTPIATNLYRFYWGDDYNYTKTDQDQTLARNSTLTHKANGADAAYCFENTTDVANMLETTLTRVIVKAQFNNGNSFYTVDDDNTEIWPADPQEDPTKNIGTEIANRMLKDVDFAQWVEDNTTGLSADDFTFTIAPKDEAAAAGDAEVTGVKLNNTGAVTGQPFNETAAIKAANSHIKLTYYAGGIAYYPVYIKHFNDQTQTPWEKSYTDVASSGIYENNSEQNYLGRYGVLRNNWYDITVNSIKGLGSAVIEEPKDDPVDKVESYISVDINILSWAKRTQNVDL